jgi:hypothetical protein
MLSCKEAARLLSEAQDRPMSAGERWGLRLHLAFCRGCRAYRRQIDFIRQACRGFAARLREPGD